MTDETPKTEHPKLKTVDELTDEVMALATPDEMRTAVHEWIARAKRYEYRLFRDREEGVECGAFFLDNASLARDGGLYLCCSACGNGMDSVDEDEELHSEGCKHRGADPMGDMIQMLSERLGPEKAAEMLAAAMNPDPDQAESHAAE